MDASDVMAALGSEAAVARVVVGADGTTLRIRRFRLERSSG